MAFGYPVSDYLQQVVSGVHPAVPPREAQYLLIFRLNFRMQRRDLSRAAWQLLSWIWQGIPLENSLSRFSRRHPEVSPERLQEWFQDWMNWQIFQKPPQ
jgi:hypothetical protein